MQFLTGRKTYIVAAALICLGAWLICQGSSSQGASMIFMGLGFTSLGDRVNRHQAEVLKAIQDAGHLVVNLRSGGGGAAAAAADLRTLAEDAAQFGDRPQVQRPEVLGCGGQLAKGPVQ